jgi:hypothetical protein
MADDTGRDQCRAAGNSSNRRAAIPRRREATNPESIRGSAGDMDSGLADFGRAPE